MLKTSATLLVLSAVLGGCVASPPLAEAPAAPEPVTVHERDRFLVSGQPSKADLAAIADRGVTTVVNMRSDGEMAELIEEDGFDERAAVEALGMTYIHIPMGRDHGYEPGQVEKLNAVLGSAEGTVYLHCASGGRARQLWMASQIDRGVMTVDEAMLASRDLGANEPSLDRLLGRRVTYELAPPEPEPEPETAAEPGSADPQ